MLQTAKSWLIKLLTVICIVCCAVALCFGISACTGADGADGKDGADGVGVSGMTYSDGVLTITLTDGSYKTVDISSAAEDGADGADGISVTNAYVSTTDGKLYIVLSNDKTIECGSVLGEDGEDGKDGVGIASVSIDSGVATTDGSSTVYTLTIKYTDSTVADTTLTFTVVNGKDGADGEDGKDGATWYSGKESEIPETAKEGDFYLDTDTGAVYTWVAATETEEAGWSCIIETILGEDGESITGATGNGIADIKTEAADNGDGSVTYTITISYTDEEAEDTVLTFTVADGKDGADGADGATWYSGTEEELPETANEGDFYLATDTGAVYTWVAETETEKAGWSCIIETILGADGESITGATGNGIADIKTEAADNGDGSVTYTITISYTDEEAEDTVLTFTVADGKDGADGEDGATWYTGSDEDVMYSGTEEITYKVGDFYLFVAEGSTSIWVCTAVPAEEGDSYTWEPVVADLTGATGDKGDTGIGIADIKYEEATADAEDGESYFAGDRLLIIIMDDETTYTFVVEQASWTYNEIVAAGYILYLVSEITPIVYGDGTVTDGWGLYYCSELGIHIEGTIHHEHDYQAVNVEADCSNNAYTYYVCDCGAIQYVTNEEGEYLDADGEVTTDPSKYVIYRTDVGEGYGDHKYVHVAAKDAACVIDGNIEYYYCSVCGTLFTYAESVYTEIVEENGEVVKATGHTFEYHPAVAATCVDGNKEYWYCTTCEKYYLSKDTMADESTAVDYDTDIVLPATDEHSIVAKITYAYNENGQLTTTANGGNLCLYGGRTTYVCENCDTISYTVEKEAYGHHTVTGEWTAADPDENGNLTFTNTCDDCGLTVTYTAPAKTDSHWHTDDSTDCELAKTLVYTLTVEDGETLSCVDSKGNTINVVSSLGFTATQNVITEAVGHTYAVGEGNDKTVILTGILAGTNYDVTRETYIYTDKEGNEHDLSGLALLGSGNECEGREALIYCDVCHNYISVTITTEHNWGEADSATIGSETVTTTAATCYADGVQVYVCADCGAAKKEAITERPEHKYVYTLATDSDGNYTYTTDTVGEGEDAYTLYTFTLCITCANEDYTEGSYTPYSETVTLTITSSELDITEPSCEDDGAYTGTLEYKDKETDVLLASWDISIPIPATGHHFYDSEKKVDVLMPEDGTTIYISNTADKVYAYYLEDGKQDTEDNRKYIYNYSADFLANNDSYNVITTVLAGDGYACAEGSTGKGVYTCYCAVIGTSGHTSSTLVTISNVVTSHTPSSTTIGYIYLDKETGDIILNTDEAEEGSYTTYYLTTDESLAGKEYETGVNYLYNIIDATCIEAGYTYHICSVCGEVYKISESDQAATGHDYAYEMSVMDEDATVDGETYSADEYYKIVITCKVCGKEIRTIYVAESNVTEVDEENTYEGDCTTAAYTTYTYELTWKVNEEDEDEKAIVKTVSVTIDGETITGKHPVYADDGTIAYYIYDTNYTDADGNSVIYSTDDGEKVYLNGELVSGLELDISENENAACKVGDEGNPEATVTSTVGCGDTEITVYYLANHSYVIFDTVEDFAETYGEADWYSSDEGAYDKYATVAAGCETDEVRYVFCSACGDFWKVVKTEAGEGEILETAVGITLDPATGHDYEAYRTDTNITGYSWYVDTEDAYADYANEAETCTENEILYVFCKTCGSFYEVVLNSTEELTDSQIKEADAGVELKLATGHTYIVSDAVLGTGDDDGYITFTLTCSTEGCSAEKIEVKVSLDNVVVDNHKDGTCTKTDSVTYTYTDYEYEETADANKNSVTDLVYTIEGVTLENAEHTYVKDADKQDIVDSYSVTIGGVYYKYYYKQCTVCGALEIVNDSTISQATEVEITEDTGEDAGTYTATINFVDDYTSYYGVEENGLSMVTGTLTISTAGYYKVEVSEGATVVITDESDTYYYNERTEINYIATKENDYINYFDAAATVAAGTVLKFTVYYYGDAYGEDAITLTISLDSEYEPKTAANYFEYTVDEEGCEIENLTETTDILVKVAGDYTIVISGEDADITIAYTNIATGNNVTDSYPEAVTVITAEAGDIITLDVYTAGNVVIIYEALTQDSTLGGTIANGESDEDDEEVGSIELTVVITESGYYQVACTGATYVIVSGGDDYYYNFNTEIGYIEDLSNVYSDYYSAAAYIPAGTILTISISGTENTDVSVTLTADAEYKVPSIYDYVDEVLTADGLTIEATATETESNSIKIYAEEAGTYTIYVIGEGTEVYDYDAEGEQLVSGTTYELTAGQVLRLDVYTADATIIIVEGNVVTAGVEAKATVEEDNELGYVTFVFVVEEAGYYTLTYSDNVTDLIARSEADDGMSAYFTTAWFGLSGNYQSGGYFVTYNTSDDAPVKVAAGTVIYVYAYADALEEVTLTIALDEDYEPNEPAGGTTPSTSNYDFTLTSAGLEITFDNVTYNYDSWGQVSYTVYVEEAGTYALTSNTSEGAVLTTEDAYTVNLSSYDGKVDSTYVEAGTVLYLSVFDADTITISAVTE